MNHIKPWQPIAVILLAVVLWYMRKKQMGGNSTPMFGQQPARAASTRPAVTKVVETPEVIYMNLRQEALAKSPGRLGLRGDLKDIEPFVVLMGLARMGRVS